MNNSIFSSFPYLIFTLVRLLKEIFTCSLILASKNNSSWGVIFSTTTARVFQGTSFVSASSSDQVYVIDSNEGIININFSNGGNTIYFNKITGEPNATGTVMITSSNNTEDRRTIIVYQTGVVDIQ